MQCNATCNAIHCQAAVMQLATKQSISDPIKNILNQRSGRNRRGGPVLMQAVADVTGHLMVFSPDVVLPFPTYLGRRDPPQALLSPTTPSPYGEEGIIDMTRRSTTLPHMTDCPVTTGKEVLTSIQAWLLFPRKAT